MTTSSALSTWTRSSGIRGLENEPCSFKIAHFGCSRLVQLRQIGLISSCSTSPNRAGLVLFNIAKSGWSRPVQHRQIGLVSSCSTSPNRAGLVLFNVAKSGCLTILTVALSVTVTVPVTEIVAVTDSTPRVKMRF